LNSFSFSFSCYDLHWIFPERLRAEGAGFAWLDACSSPNGEAPTIASIA